MKPNSNANLRSGLASSLPPVSSHDQRCARDRNLVDVAEAQMNATSPEPHDHHTMPHAADVPAEAMTSMERPATPVTVSRARTIVMQGTASRCFGIGSGSRCSSASRPSCGAGWCSTWLASRRQPSRVSVRSRALRHRRLPVRRIGVREGRTPGAARSAARDDDADLAGDHASHSSSAWR